MTFPYLPKLSCFQDRTLYFSRLPRDILEYCLKPLLVHHHPFPRVPCAEEWILPVLIQTITIPEGFGSEDTNTLANGNLLLINTYGHDLQVGNFSTNQTLWTAQNLSVRRYMYNEALDVLLMHWVTPSQSVCYLVKNCSQLRTSEEFLAQLTNPLPETQYSVLTDQWKCAYPLSEAHLAKLKQAVKSLSLPSSSILESAYFGGYIIVTRRSTHSPVTEYMEFYQCLA